jgi:hypothetical protein
LHVSDADYTAMHAKEHFGDSDRMKDERSGTEAPRKPRRWGDEGAPEPKFEREPEVFAKWSNALRHAAAIDDGDEGAMDADTLAEQAMEHLDNFSSEDDPDEKAEHLARAMRCVANALESHMKTENSGAHSMLRFAK